MCLLRVKNWIFKHNYLHFVYKELKLSTLPRKYIIGSQCNWSINITSDARVNTRMQNVSHHDT
jgi:hypothetical protein